MAVLARFAGRLHASLQAAASAWSMPRGDAPNAHDLIDVLERSLDCVVQFDACGHLTYFNPAARDLLKGPRGAMATGHGLSACLAMGTLRQIVRFALPALHAHGVWVGEVQVHIGDRRKVPFSVMAFAHFDDPGRASRFSAVMRDISADAQARQQIQRQNEVLGAITEALPATVVVVDSQGRYRFVNSAFERYVGQPASQILGRSVVDVLGEEEVARRRPYMKRAIAGEPVEFTLNYPGVHGMTYLALNCIPLNLDGVVDGFVGIGQDVTAQRRERERLTNLARRDPLTGLLNRAGFEQRARDDVCGGHCRRALLYVDLDHFKPVNDSFGHQAGDRLLQMFAQRLGEAVRSGDVVARLGGDEFAVLLDGVGSVADAEMVASKVLAAARMPFEIEGRILQISASIGIAVMDDHSNELADLISRADQLLYQAKAAGRGRHSSGSRAPAAAGVAQAGD